MRDEKKKKLSDLWDFLLVARLSNFMGFQLLNFFKRVQELENSKCENGSEFKKKGVGFVPASERVVMKTKKRKR